jgi:glycosyltransferase involved in cell wall biosynthesis
MIRNREARRPRVLYLAFYFPPSRASGVYRARATANHLSDDGWDVTVMAAPLSFLYHVVGSVDEALAGSVRPDVKIVRPSLSHYAWERDLRRFGRLRRTSPVLAQRVYAMSQARIFPESYWSWGLNAVRAALRRHVRRRFDVVVATGNPFASFGAAWMFNRLTGVPYVVDYRDSWTLNLFTDGPGFPPKHPVWKWEKRILRRAAGASFVNEALRQWHADSYPKYADRMLVVPNGWDPDLMPTAAPDSSVAPHPERGLRFAYLGTISSAQPVDELIASFERARKDPALADAQLNLHGHLGFFKAGQELLSTRLGLSSGDGDDPESGIRYRGPVSKVEVDRVYSDSDVLVFMAGGAKYVTSGKIFEYMAAGRPIVSVHAPGIAATEVLNGYPLWFNADSLDPDAIAETMVAAGKAAREMTPQMRAAAQAHAASFTRDKTLEPLVERLRAVVLEHRGTTEEDR